MKAAFSVLFMLSLAWIGSFPALSETPTPTPTAFPDLDASGYVGEGDLFVTSSGWRVSTGPGVEEAPADVDGDGKSDANDILRILENWGTYSIPPPVLLSVTPEHGPPGTIVTIQVEAPEMLRGQGGILFGSTLMPFLSVSDATATTLTPALSPGSTELSLVVADRRSSSFPFEIESAQPLLLPPGEVSLGVIESASEIGGVLRSAFAQITAKRKLDKGTIEELESALATVEILTQAAVNMIADLGDEDKRFIDGILYESGISGAFGVTGGVKSSVSERTRVLRELLHQKGAYDEFYFRVGLDSLSFVLSTIVRPALVIGAISATVTTGVGGAAVLEVALVIEALDKIIDAFASTDLRVLHIVVTPDNPPNLNVGETASVSYFGDFSPQDNLLSSTISAVISAILPGTAPETVVEVLKSILKDYLLDLGVSVTSDLFNLEQPEPDILNVPVPIEYYSSTLSAILANASSLTALLGGEDLGDLIQVIGYGVLPYFGSTPMASKNPSVFEFSEGGRRLIARSPSAISTGNIESNVWQLKKLENRFNPFRYLGIEWPKGVELEMAQVQIQPDPSWIRNPVNNHYYRLTDRIPWLEAKATAEGWGGYLVTINNSAEEVWLDAIFNNAIARRAADMWIGLNDTVDESQWRWMNGEPVTYTHWYPGQPSNGIEDAATMNYFRENSGSNPGWWNDWPIASSFPAIVERDTAP